MIFACFLFILVNLDLTSALQWTSSATLADNSTVEACRGQDVELGWQYSIRPEEHVQTVEWYYSPGNDTDEIFAAIIIGGRLFPSPNITTRMAYIPNAGLRLLSVSSADNGLYTARVTINLHGTMETHVQRAHVISRDPSSMTTDGHLHVELELQPQSITNATKDDHLMLSCGRFTGYWASHVDVVWKTPWNQTLPSTSYDNGRFLLAVPNPIANGEYSCSIASPSPAAACLNSSNNTPLLSGASIVVDALEARLALMQGQLQAIRFGRDERLQALENQLHGLEAQNSLMKGEIQDLRTNISVLAGEVQSLESENGVLKQQLQQAALSVGFHARKRNNKPTYELGDIVIFEEVLTNQGGAYNSTSGLFVAPVNGTYAFHVTIVLDRDSPATASRHVKLMVDDTWVAIATSSYKDHFEMGSCHAVVTLTAGQKVYVIADNNNAQYIGTDNTFSGALLHANLMQ